MAVKTYNHENVTYAAHGHHWKFEAPGYSYTTPRMPMGKPTADKMARIISGSLKRQGTLTNGLDGLAGPTATPFSTTHSRRSHGWLFVDLCVVQETRCYMVPGSVKWLR